MGCAFVATRRIGGGHFSEKSGGVSLNKSWICEKSGSIGFGQHFFYGCTDKAMGAVDVHDLCHSIAAGLTVHPFCRLCHRSRRARPPCGAFIELECFELGGDAGVELVE